MCVCNHLSVASQLRRFNQALLAVELWKKISGELTYKNIDKLQAAGCSVDYLISAKLLPPFPADF